MAVQIWYQENIVQTYYVYPKSILTLRSHLISYIGTNQRETTGDNSYFYCSNWAWSTDSASNEVILDRFESLLHDKIFN